VAFSTGVASSTPPVSSTPVNSTCQQASIFPSSKEMLR
jgi:hypothetical protein